MNQSERKTMKHNLLTSALCLVLLMVMMLSTTLAWFTDTQSNVNTMVAGKISIEQTETDKDGNTFVGTNFIMMPAVEIVKNVTVENTGNQPAYVRTLFAFEDKAYIDENGVDRTVVDMLTAKTPDGVSIVIPTGTDKVQFTVTRNVDGENVTASYTVGYYVHPIALSHEDDKDDITVLNSITLKGEADNEWQIAVDDDYELIVLSQASQVSGLGDDAKVALNTAFAPITGDWCAAWFARVLGGTANGNAITIANP